MYSNKLSLMLILLISQFSLAQDKATVLENHALSISKIRSIVCKINIEYHNLSPPFTEESATVFWSNRKMRIKHLTGWIGKSDVYVNDGITKSQTVGQGQKINDVSNTNGMIANNNMPYNCDPWNYGLLTVPGITKLRIPFKELVDHPECLLKSFTVTGAGLEKRFVFELNQPKADKLRVVIDPNRGYLISEILHGQKGESVVHTVESFSEPKPGIFFPKIVKSRIVDSDRNWIVTFSNVQVNEPLPDGAFDFRFLPGTIVMDQIQKEVFRANNQGEPVLPALISKGRRLTYGDTLPPRASVDKQASKQATSEESDNRLSILIIVVSILFISCGCFLFYRRRRQNDNG